jgi:hypothetical protein
LEQQPTPTVFVSYSHKDEDWKDKLLPHLRILETAGLNVRIWEDRQIDAGAQWYPEIQQAMEQAVAAVLLISADYLASAFCVKEEVPFLLKRQESAGMLLVPLLVRDCLWKAHRWLSARQMVPRDDKSLASDFPGKRADKVFKTVTESVWKHIEKLAGPVSPSAWTYAYAVPIDGLRTLVRGETVAVTPPEPESLWPALSSDCIDLSRLPETGAELFGRDAELDRLDRAWDSAGTDQPVRVLAFVAQGGVGKSTLVRHWLTEMERDRFRGAAKVFGWSFYSQGVEGREASGDAFVDAGLRFFGDPDPTLGSPWDKGERLAGLVEAERALLVLDGLEPLQSGQSFERGRLRDPALATLLRNLARGSRGLCLISTRESLPDLAGFSAVETRDLDAIGPAAGRALLRAARVVGSDRELEELAERYGPLALTIALLGIYLRETDSGRGAAGAARLDGYPGAPLDRVLAGFEQRLAGQPEAEALALLGFFERPADAGCLGALRAEPAIPGLTDSLAALDEAGWLRALHKLEKLRLVRVHGLDGDRPVVDAHPLLREHFARRLAEARPDAWREGHRRLYEHLKAQAPHRPETLAGLQPLYQGVAHGCLAGLYQEALDKVYIDRILRYAGDGGFYSLNKLGAFGADLGAVAGFFAETWTRPQPALAAAAQSWLFNQAAVCLRALGRLDEARAPMRAGLEMAVEADDWTEAAIRANNLSELELSLGEIEAAGRDAGLCVDYADRSGDAFQRIVNRATLADGLHQQGRRAAALERFREAEAREAERFPDTPLLDSLPDFRYCDLLLAEAERAAWRVFLGSTGVPPVDAHAREVCAVVTARAAQTLDWCGNRFSNASLLTLAHDHLTLARVALYRVVLEAASPESARRELRAAVDGLRAYGDMTYLPAGLLTRAWLRKLDNDEAGALADLDEVKEIAERGGMKLYLADMHLHRARLFRDRAALAEARRLIEACGYSRRREELEDAERALAGAS